MTQKQMWGVTGSLWVGCVLPVLRGPISCATAVFSIRDSSVVRDWHGEVLRAIYTLQTLQVSHIPPQPSTSVFSEQRKLFKKTSALKNCLWGYLPFSLLLTFFFWWDKKGKSVMGFKSAPLSDCPSHLDPFSFSLTLLYQLWVLSLIVGIFHGFLIYIVLFRTWLSLVEVTCQSPQNNGNKAENVICMVNLIKYYYM